MERKHLELLRKRKQEFAQIPEIRDFWNNRQTKEGHNAPYLWGSAREMCSSPENCKTCKWFSEELFEISKVYFCAPRIIGIDLSTGKTAIGVGVILLFQKNNSEIIEPKDSICGFWQKKE